MQQLAKSAFLAINEFLKLGGFKIVRLNRPTRTYGEFFEHVKSLDFYPDTVIDVGAASGTMSLHEAFPKAKFILVEPLEEFLPHLKRLEKKYNCHIFNQTVGAADGTVTINVSPDLYGSGIAAPGEVLEGNGRPTKISTLDSLVDRVGAIQSTLLKLDTQGYEIQALNGFKRNIQFCEVIIVEVTIFIECETDFYSVTKYMKDHGFVVYDVLDGLLRPLDNSLGQIDLVFVKEHGIFRVNSNWS